MRNSRILGRLVSISTIVAIGLFSAENARAEADTFGFGSGRSGDVTISGSGMVVNSYASVTADVATGATTIQVDAATGFAAGDLIMIWKSTGLALTRAPGSQVTIPMDGDSTGTFEYARIKSIATNVITLTNPIVSASTFTAAQSQVVRIPEFHTLTIDASASIVAGAWDGTKGGIAVVFADNGVVNNGTLSADGQGLRGGFHKQDETVFGCGALDGPAVNTVLGVVGLNVTAGGAKKGEGLFPNSYSTDTTTDATNPLGALYPTYGYGNVSTGGGGGDCHNAGGGGGGHAGVGGTGGHTFTGNEGTLFNDSDRAVGGTGGTIITYTPTVRVSMGGGGGAGEDNDNVGTAGAAGGGVVFVRATSLTGTGSLSADGATAANSVTSNYDGAGGGGAGGLVVVRVMTNAACGAIHANGGAGGNAQDQHGPGGGGAGGYIMVQAATDTCGTTATETGGGAGIDRLDDGGNDGTHGATGGGDGSTASPPPGGFNPTPCDVGAGTCGGCTGPEDCAPGDTCNPTTNQCDFPDGGVDDGGIGFDAGAPNDGGTNDGGLTDGGSRDGGSRDGGFGDGGDVADASFGDGGNGNGDGGNGDLFDLGSLEGGGCGCSTPGSSGSGNAAGFAIAAMAALAFVRRKRK